MKYIKTIIEINEGKYQSISSLEKIIIEKFVRDFCDINKILKLIKKLTFDSFEESNFDYHEIFTNILSINDQGKMYYSTGNIYYELDNFCTKNKLNISTVILRNFFTDLIEKIYDEYNIEKYLDNRLINIFERNIGLYKEALKLYDLSNNVKKSLEYILNAEKFNL